MFSVKLGSVTDRDRWGLRGPVHTCRIQHTGYLRRCGPNSSEGDACETKEHTDVTSLQFRPDGFLAHQRHRNPDGSEWTITYEYDETRHLTFMRNENGTGLVYLTLYEYDASGRLIRVVHRSDGAKDRTAETYQYDTDGLKTKTIHVDPAQHPPITGWGVEGSDSFYPAKGAATVSTRYNQREQPTELLFHDQSNRLLSRVDFRYDQNGNLVEEAQTDIAGAMLAEMGASMSEAQLEAVRKLLGGSFQLHRYDEQGRKVGTRRRIGQLSEENDTMNYNEHGDRIEAIHESTGRGYNLKDDEGQVSETPSEERSNRSETFFRYDYDARGNWVRKAVESRTGEVFSVDHRTIDYFE